jgi:hypothetical protein
MNHAQGNASVLIGYQDQNVQKPEGAFTTRIRGLAADSEMIRHRLSLVLSHLRVPPPAPADLNAATGRQACVDDYLQRAESANKTVADALTELEGLFA